MSTSHLAGCHITVSDRYVRQICQWCGYRLVDVDLANVAVAGEGVGDDGDSFPRWAIHAWIRVDGHVWSVVETDNDEKMPGDACMRDVAPLVRLVPNTD